MNRAPTGGHSLAFEKLEDKFHQYSHHLRMLQFLSMLRRSHCWVCTEADSSVKRTAEVELCLVLQRKPRLLME